MALSLEQVDRPKLSAPSPHLRHILELDGVRGLAALLVFFHHLCFTSIDPTGWSAPVRALFEVFRYGTSGVDLFFALSGFLITSLLIEARSSPSYYQDFYWKRALRILPLYIFCMVGVLLLIPGSKSTVLLSVFFLSNFATLFHVTAQGPFWTLAIEEQFYILWPTVVRRRPVDQLRRWAFRIGVAVIGLRLLAACFGHYNYQLTFLRCDGLAFGAYLACWHSQRGPAKPNSTRESRSIALAFAAGAILISPALLPLASGWNAFLAAAYQTGLTLLAVSAIAYLISHTGQRHLAWLRHPPLTFFGLISYAMYMLHIYVLYFYDARFGVPTAGHNLAYAVRLGAVLAVTIALCLLTRHLIELPATSLRKYVLSKPRAS